MAKQATTTTSTTLVEAQLLDQTVNAVKVNLPFDGIKKGGTKLYSVWVAKSIIKVAEVQGFLFLEVPEWFVNQTNDYWKQYGKTLGIIDQESAAHMVNDFKAQGMKGQTNGLDRISFLHANAA